MFLLTKGQKHDGLAKDMMKLVSSITIAAVVSIVTAGYLNDQINSAPEETERAHKVSINPVDKKSRSESLTGRIARIKMDSRGHFMTKAKMNGRSIEVLVDTGATSVAIDEKTARKLGIRLNKSDYKYKVSTANGIIKAAKVQIDRIQIGRVSVRDVEAAVLQGNGLGGTLLGMSFLGQLREFKIRNRELIMRQ